MKKLSYKNITTRDELLARVENGKLSVGCWLNNIKKFLTLEKESPEQIAIEVTYSATYGTRKQTLYI